MPRKKAKKRKPATRRNCSIQIPPMSRKEFEERAARGVVGTAKGLLDSPTDILDGRRDICLHGESLLNMEGDRVEFLQAKIEEGLLGYVIVHEGLTEVMAISQDEIDGVLGPPYQSVLHAKDCVNKRVDFSLGIFYDPKKIDKKRAEKLRDCLESACPNPAAIGRLLGYSEDDICAFYKRNHNYARCMKDMNFATKNDVPSPEKGKEEDKPAA